MPGSFFRQVQEGKNIVTGLHAVHADMEVAAQLPHGKKVGGGQKDQDDGPLPAYLPLPQVIKGVIKGNDDPAGSAAIGYGVHEHGAEQLHGQDFHGDLPEEFRFFSQFLFSCGIILVDL